MSINNNEKWYKNLGYKILIYGGGLVIAIAIGLFFDKYDDTKADLISENRIDVNSNIFGLTSETISIENKKEGILDEVAYLFNMQENETSVITNDNEVFFIREILNNESTYLVVIKKTEGVKSILLDNEWFNQNELLKDHVKKEIEVLNDEISNK